MCTGRIDPAFIIRAFSNGTDGVFIGGCWLGECHYITEGNHDALSMMHLTRKLLKQIGINPERLRFESVSAAEGIRFTEVVNDFTSKLRKLGPLGISEGIDNNELQFKLKAVNNILPYVKLVERERMRVHFNTREEYDKYFTSEEANRLFNETIVDQLAISQILLLLQEKSLSTGEIADTLGLSPSEVSKYLKRSTRDGLVRFDQDQKLFVPAIG